MSYITKQLAAPTEVLCKIGPCSRTISTEIQAWVVARARHAKQQTGGHIEAIVWPYRHEKVEHLSVDLIGTQGATSFTFITGFAPDFGIDDILVPDMTEALAMTMLLLKEINAQVTFYL